MDMLDSSEHWAQQPHMIAEVLAQSQKGNHAPLRKLFKPPNIRSLAVSTVIFAPFGPLTMSE
jgi:hypothetical protein